MTTKTAAYDGAIGEVGIRGASEVNILNVGGGHTKISFDKSNPEERIRAARIVKDMIRRGYSLLVEVEVKAGKGKGEKKFVLAHDFDESVCEYIIADFDSLAAAEADRDEASAPAAAASTPAPTVAKKGRKGMKGVPAETTRSVAVGRNAGG